MPQKTSEFKPVTKRLERQATELIHEDTDLLVVVSGFSFSDTPVSGTAAKKCEAKYGYRPMVYTFYCKELAGFTTTELSEYLADAERACARTLGFDPEQFASDKTLQTELHLTAHGVIASLTGSNRSSHSLYSVSSRLPTTWATRSECAHSNQSTTDCSNRTERRYVTEKIKDVTDAFCQIVFPAIDLGPPDEGTQYGNVLDVI